MKCSICHMEGHKSNNKKFHSAHKVEVAAPAEVPVDMEKTAFLVFLDNKIQEFIEENNTEILASVEKRDKDLLLRIENFRRDKLTVSERLETTVDSILESIKTNTALRGQFRKDPTRQSIHEKAQIEWVQTHQYTDAVKMNADTNGTCLSKKKIHIINKENPRPSGATKTFDMYIPSKKMFAVLKHTAVPGGAQDNQFKDVQHFIKQAVGYLTDNPAAEETFAFYLDGAYYTTKKILMMDEMIPAALKSRVILTNCASVKPAVC